MDAPWINGPSDWEEHTDAEIYQMGTKKRETEILEMLDTEIEELESAYQHHLKHLNADEMFAFAVAKRRFQDFRLRVVLSAERNQHPAPRIAGG